MPLVIPYASALADAAAQILRDHPLPQLRRLLAGQSAAFEVRDLEPGGDAADDRAFSFTPPHEAALAWLNGWTGGDGRWPFAAWHAQQDGIATTDLAWGELTPVHWAAGRDHVKLVSPDALALDESTSRALWQAVEPLFASEGLRCAWGAPLRWYVAGPDLDGLRTASTDRVVGRNIDTWLPYDTAARRMRRLQQEVQMLLYQHPLHDERVATGRLPVNSFWLSGCGRAQPVSPADPARTVQWADMLRGPALSEDWQAWAEAWRDLDATVIGPWLDNPAHSGDQVLLCGERRYVALAARPAGWFGRWQRWWASPDPAALMATL